MEKVTDIKHARAFRDLIKSLDAAGWNVHRPLTARELGGPTVYLYDAETRYRQMVVYPKVSLSFMAERAAVAKIDFQVAGNCLHDLLSDLGHQKVARSPDTDTAMMVATGLYLMSTRIYSATKDIDMPVHYVILRYAAANHNFLRPASVLARETMTPDEIEECALGLLTMEQMKHPERFMKQEGSKPTTPYSTQGVPGTSPSNPPKPRPRR